MIAGIRPPASSTTSMQELDHVQLIPADNVRERPREGRDAREVRREGDTH
jgi:hypothetical protein